MPHLHDPVFGPGAPVQDRLRPALRWLAARGAGSRPPVALVAEYLRGVLPHARADEAGETHGAREVHEVAWALGDLLAEGGLVEQAALCRSVETHRRLAAWSWAHSFPGVPAVFWQTGLRALATPDRVPDRAAYSLSSTRALLEAVGEGLALDPPGRLPRELVLGLDDRFRWTEEFPWMRRRGAVDIPPLGYLHHHLLAQRLLEHRGDRLLRTAEGDRCLHDLPRLWRRMVDPAPRWSSGFERDALGVLAAAVLRSADIALGRIGEDLAHVLTAKWRPAQVGSLFDAAAPVAQSWYQLGVPLGWWDTGRGPADRRPNVFGRAAAVAVLRAVAAPLSGWSAAP